MPNNDRKEELRRRAEAEREAKAKKAIWKEKPIGAQKKREAVSEVPPPPPPLSEENYRTVQAEKVHGKKEFENYKGKKWKLVNFKIDFAKNSKLKNPNRYWAYLGKATAREKLFFDESSPIMQDLKQQVEKIFKDNQQLSLKEKFQKLDEFIAGLNGPKKGREERANKFIIDNLPNITIDQFIRNKTLKCRHNTLITASLLCHLMSKNLLDEGSVHSYRSNIFKENASKPSAHTWVLYTEEKSGQIWIVDTTWHVYEKIYGLNTQVEFLRKYYGDKTIDNMLNRIIKAQEELTKSETVKKENTVDKPPKKLRFKSDVEVIPNDSKYIKKVQFESQDQLIDKPNFLVNKPLDMKAKHAQALEKLHKQANDIAKKLKDEEMAKKKIRPKKN